jgi:hypothetical protein
MPPRGVKSAKRGRQYEHIKDSVKKRGGSTKRAKEIAARTVNKQRSEAGQTKGSAKRRTTKRAATTKRTAKKRTARKSSAKRTTRKASSRKTTRKSSGKKR